MMGILGGDEHCPIARSLDVLGEKWTLLIVREAMLGATRFSQFQRHLGVPREVLTARLSTLVDSGVLKRSAYKPETGRSRDEYVLTEAGRDLSPVLLAIAGWALQHRPASEPPDLKFVDSETEAAVRVAAVNVGTGQVVPLGKIALVRVAPDSEV